MNTIDMKLVIDENDHVTIEKMNVVHTTDSPKLVAIMKAIEDAIRGRQSSEQPL